MMAEKFVALTSFSSVIEARMVLNHLEEGEVRAFLSGEMTASVLTNLRAMGPQVGLHVAEVDLKRALDILACLRESEPLLEDWEDEAESGEDVWICGGCAEAVEREQSTCPYCGYKRS